MRVQTTLVVACYGVSTEREGIGLMSGGRERLDGMAAEVATNIDARFPRTSPDSQYTSRYSSA